MLGTLGEKKRMLASLELELEMVVGLLLDVEMNLGRPQDHPGLLTTEPLFRSLKV